MPLRPSRPRPPPGVPTAVGWFWVASISEKVSPSAPVPPFNCAVNEAARLLVDTGVVEKAEPATSAVAAGVSWIVPAAPVAVAEPFNCQPVVMGGTTPIAVPEIGRKRAPCPSSLVISYCAVFAPIEVGVKVTCWTYVWSGPITWPSGSGEAELKSESGALALVTVTGMFPVLVMLKVLVTVEPSGTMPKSSGHGETVKWPWPTIELPVSEIVTVCVTPGSSGEVEVTVIESVFVPVTVGL